MDGVGRVISSAATGVGLVAGTAMGVSLVKGFDRVTTIQDSARALTLTLGDATKAADLLAQVLKIVTGTPFALDQFAAAAQQLISFGVAADKVPGILTAVGDASASQGKRAGEFAGRLIEVFGQIAAKGRVQLMDVWRISETGVNALAILANNFGVTTTEMQKMIEKGAVPAGDAIDALVLGIENGSKGIAGQTIALGGLAQTLGTTLSGSLANLKIAFSRFGASIITPLTEPLTKFFQALRTGIDELGKRFGDRISEMTASPGFQRFLDFLLTVPSRMGPLIDALKELGPVLVPVGAALAAIVSTNLGAALGPLGAFLPAVNPVLAAFAALVATQPKLRAEFAGLGDEFRGLINRLMPVAKELVDRLLPVVAALVPVVVKLGSAVGEALVDALIKLAPVVPSLAEAFVSIASSFADVLIAAAPLLPIMVQIAVPILQVAAAFIQLADSLGILAPLIAGIIVWTQVIAPIMALVSTISALGGVTAALAAFFPGLTAAFLALLGPVGLVIAGIAALGIAIAVVVKNWDSIKAAAAAAFNWIIDHWPLLLAIITGPFGAVAALVITQFDKIKNAASAAWGFIQSVFSGAVNLIQAILDNWFRVLLGIFTGGFSELFGLVVRHWADITAATSALVEAIVGFFVGLPGRIAGGIAELIRLVQSMASDIVGFFVGLPGRIVAGLTSFVESVVSAFRSVKSGAASALGELLNFVKEIPGKIISAFGNYKDLLYNIGRAIIDGLIRGLKSLAGAVKDTVKGIAGGAVKGVKGLLGIGSPSKVFAEIGANVVQGFVDGIQNNSGAAKRAMDAFLPSKADDFFNQHAKFTTALAPSRVAAPSADAQPAIKIEQTFNNVREPDMPATAAREIRKHLYLAGK